MVINLASKDIEKLMLTYKPEEEDIDPQEDASSHVDGVSNGAEGVQSKYFDLTGWELALVTTANTDISSFYERKPRLFLHSHILILLSPYLSLTLYTYNSLRPPATTNCFKETDSL
ncbi:hypothetical protein L1887_36874 [Cichorium endivia]|nr:hypothetical protein L1887_36874 [Cichorium endivia]